MTILENAATAFRPTIEFVQTCGACGSVFRVELESRTTKNDRQTYSCPECAHHLCQVGSPKPPRVTLVRRGEGRTTAGD
ncbi:MAG: hypothetical protein IT496_02050 [Gammaproteobacteria bacterium]|nr:hypothetical protein [Gammaproteobacteria bacterium]